MSDDEATTLLDNPVWAALSTTHRALAQGGANAKRYLPDVGPFAALADRTPAAFQALSALVPAGGAIALNTVEPITPPPGLIADMQAPLAQMVLTQPIAAAPAGPDALTLGVADVPDMLDLTGRTRPGPFGPRTIELGRYLGVRIDGALAAMAGERMRFDRFVEVSAICVDPAHRGKGLAASLMVRLIEEIQAKGLTPFLHVFADNAGAIALYEKLGFVVRRTLHLSRLTTAASSRSPA